MPRTIGHVVGLDEIHKRKFVQHLPSDIKIIDLDEIQQEIYNHPLITKLKQQWSDKQIKINRCRQRGGNRNQQQITKLNNQKKNLKKKIYHEWHNLMKGAMDGMNVPDSQTNNVKPYASLVFLGFNVHPKDYRQKIPIGSVNNLVFDCESRHYASNQIKYFLEKHSDMIIRGQFPLNLLNIDFLADKHVKLIDYYIRQGYTSLHLQEIFDAIVQTHRIPDKSVSKTDVFREDSDTSSIIVPSLSLPETLNVRAPESIKKASKSLSQDDYSYISDPEIRAIMRHHYTTINDDDGNEDLSLDI